MKYYWILFIGLFLNCSSFINRPRSLKKLQKISDSYIENYKVFYISDSLLDIKAMDSNFSFVAPSYFIVRNDLAILKTSTEECKIGGISDSLEISSLPIDPNSLEVRNTISIYKGLADEIKKSRYSIIVPWHSMFYTKLWSERILMSEKLMKNCTDCQTLFINLNRVK